MSRITSPLRLLWQTAGLSRTSHIDLNRGALHMTAIFRPEAPLSGWFGNRLRTLDYR